MIKVIVGTLILSYIVCSIIGFIGSKIINPSKNKIKKSRVKAMSVLILTVSICLFIHIGQSNLENRKINLEGSSASKILNSAEEIEVKKKVFSFRKHYYVLVEGQLVGEITGKLFNIFGDVLEFRDINNQLIKKESQIKRFGMTNGKLFNVSFDRLAKIEDVNGVTGYIGEERLKDILKFNHIQYFYDNEYNKKGSAKPNIPIFSKDYKIRDNDNNIDYVIDGNLFSIFNNYKIEVNDSTEVDATDAIFYTIIEDSIIDSKTKSSNKSSKSKK